MTDDQRHRIAVFGNPLGFYGRAPGTVYSKKLLEHAVEVLTRHHEEEQKNKKAKKK